MHTEYTTEKYKIVPRIKKYYFGLLEKVVYDLFLGQELLKTFDTNFEAEGWKNKLESI